MSDKYILSKQPGDLHHPLLIVCEGWSDARFVSRLLEYKTIANCSVGCPSIGGFGGGGGLEGIQKYLLAIQGITAGKKTLRGILLMIDANDKPDQRFSIMQKALTDAKFPAPTKSFKIEPYTVEGDPFRVAIFLIPKEGEKGTLDALLLEAALNENPKMRDCLDKFCDCTGKVKSWTPNKQSKMRLSALVAASCENNPWASAAIMWSEKGCPVSIESKSFTRIAEFLTAFASQ